MKIGAITLENPLVFAPLAGISNLPMRLSAKAAGCALVYSEMISASGLVYGTAKTWFLLNSTPQEKPLNVQLFGSDPVILADAAQQVVAAGADMVDINFGCAVKKILKSGSGVALMRDLPKAERVLAQVRAAVKIPLTIKIRTGWDPSGSEALALARIAQGCGVDAIVVHPRTARQGFSGRADWSLIGRIKASVSIPVIGNGDVRTPEDAVRMRDQTGCDGLMVGRAAIGNPFIFEQIRARLDGLESPAINLRQRFAVMDRYVCDSVAFLGEKRACLVLRSRLGWFVKGLPQARELRRAIRFIASEAQARALLKTFEHRLAASAAVPL